jgi:hypothetical protein
MGKTANYIVVGLVIIALLGCGYVGYTMYPRLNKCPDIASDTVVITDTVSYYIPDTIPYYLAGKDSIVYDTLFRDVDTAAILKDYFAMHYYERSWQDSSLSVLIKDVISQNQPISNVFTYKILRPQTVIHNEYTDYAYGRYITAGMNFLLKDLDYTGIEINYISPNWNGGVGYNFGLEGMTVKVGGTLFKFK